MVEAMLDLARLAPEDVLMDLGSGDGRIVMSAAKRGIRAIGIENNPEMVAYSQDLIASAGLENFAEIRQQSMFDARLQDATVITLFGDRNPIFKLLPRLAALPRGTRIVSNTFHLWEHAAESTIPHEAHFHTARLWELP